MMMLPRNWLAAVFGLMTRPQSNEPRKRLTLTSPVTALTRTSLNTAPRECIDQCRVPDDGGALASTVSSSRRARLRIEA